MLLSKIRPGTRTRLLDATLRVVAREGLRAATHRKIASEAGVSLSATSYHFDSIETMLFEAMSHYTQTRAERWGDAFQCIDSEADAVDAVTKIVTEMNRDSEDLTLLYELYAQASRDPKYLGLVRSWSDRTMAGLDRYYPHEIVVRAAAFWDGYFFHQLTGEPAATVEFARSTVREILRGNESAQWRNS